MPYIVDVTTKLLKDSKITIAKTGPRSPASSSAASSSAASSSDGDVDMISDAPPPIPVTDEARQLDLQGALVGKVYDRLGPVNGTWTMSSFELYRVLMEHLISKESDAGSSDLKLSWLSLDLSLDPSIIFKLNDAGRFNRQNDIIAKKRAALDRFFGVRQANPDPERTVQPLEEWTFPAKFARAYTNSESGKIDAIGVIGKAYIQKPETDFSAKTLDDLAAIDSSLDVIINGINAQVPSLISELNKLIGKKSDDYPFTTRKKDLRDILFRQDLNLSVRQQIASNVFSCFSMRCKKTATIIRYGLNRMQNLANYLYKDYKDGYIKPNNPAFEAALAVCLTAFKTAQATNTADEIIVALFAKNSLFVDNSYPDEILKRACKMAIAQISLDCGFDILRSAQMLQYDEPGLIGDLLTELSSQTSQLLDILVIGVGETRDGAAYQKFGNMTPHQIYDYDEYARLVSRRKGGFLPEPDDNGVVPTPDSSGNIPLIESIDLGFRFLNCGSYLFLKDNIAPDQMVIWEKSPEVTWQVVGLVKSDITNSSYNFKFDWRCVYRSLYGIDGAGIMAIAMREKPAGFSSMGRVDEAMQGLYAWHVTKATVDHLTAALSKMPGMADVTGERAIQILAGYLNLDAKSRITDADWPKITNNLVKFGDFLYFCIKVPPVNDSDPIANYVLCNSPTKTLNESLSKFEIMYYRRIELGDDASNLLSKVIKSSTDTKSVNGRFRNRPQAADVPSNYRKLDDDNHVIELGIDLPIAFQIPENYQNFHTIKSDMASIKSKGNPLTKNIYLRQDAGQVMKSIIPYVAPWAVDPPDTVSASQLATMAMGQKNATDSWRRWKSTEQSDLPTLQEWCHLRGHGDGGGEQVGNFVAGSKHCNTEQLAIEDAQRPTTRREDQAYVLNATAYLVPSRSMIYKSNRSYLGLNPDYEQAAFTTNADKRSAMTDSDADASQAVKKEPDRQVELDRAGSNAPLGGFLRYKVKKGRTKVLDHVFEAQSEFFDANQFNILNATVTFLIDHDRLIQELAAAADKPATKAQS